MANQVTAQELKKYIFENNKIEYVLQQLGCRFIVFHPQKNYWTSTQPDENADNLMGVVICQNEYLNYYSYSRNVHINERRDLFYLVQQVKNFSFFETMKYVCKLFGLNYSYNKQENKKEERPKNPLDILIRHKHQSNSVNVYDYQTYDESILNDFVPMIHEDLYKEGIMPWTVKKFGLGYSYKYKRTIFPHRAWDTGELIGYNARTSIENYDEFGIKKYFISPGLHKEINVYGYYENYTSIKQADYVVVYESEKSVLKRDSLGDGTGVAISGHSLSIPQMKILNCLDVHEIVIAMDKDIPLVEIWHICSKFFRLRKVSYIYDKYNLLGPKDSPADARAKVYDFLFKYRVTYTDEIHKKYEESLKKRS